MIHLNLYILLWVWVMACGVEVRILEKVLRAIHIRYIQ